MAIVSPLKARRLKAKQTEATRQLIVFRLRQEWFALEIQSVQKVLPLGQVYGDPQATGVSLTIYQEKELLVVDVGKRIFRETNPEAIAQTEQRYLLIVQNAQRQIVGLPIDSLPALHRVPESAFSPLPSGYVTEANIQCVSSVMVQTQSNQPPYFLLNPEQLVQPHKIINRQLAVDS